MSDHIHNAQVGPAWPNADEKLIIWLNQLERHLEPDPAAGLVRQAAERIKVLNLSTSDIAERMGEETVRLRDQLAAVTAERDELIKDKDRLDWLEKMAEEHKQQWTFIVTYSFDTNYDDIIMFCSRDDIDKAKEVGSE